MMVVRQPEGEHMTQMAAMRRTAPRMSAPLLAAAVFGSAFIARILPLLRGGGLRGYGSYDDTVYFASALGWIHGRWPYRDFFLVQPPGIVVALAPFAVLDRWFGDPGGLAAARLAWMILGSLTAVGLVVLLWRTSRLAAVVAGLFYAVFWPAGMVERVTDLEGPQNFLLVAALLLVRPFGPPRTSTRAAQSAALIAGVALGLAWSVKIWELAPIVVLAGWLALRRPITELRWYAAGVVGSVSAICLPFFLHSPRQMWTMVVRDELRRPRHPGWAKRLVYTTGTNHLVSIHRFGPGLVVVLVVVVTVVVLALRRPAARLIVALYLAAVAVLLESPPTFAHYGAFVAPSFAILFGVATTEAVGLVRRWKPVGVRRLGQGLVGVIVGGILLMLAHAPATARLDHPVPTGQVAAIADALPGCVSYDEPSQALSLNLASRDLTRGCPFVADLGGASSWNHLRHLVHGRPSRSAMTALRYLRSASACLLYRYPPGPHGRHPVNIIGGWTLLARSHGLRLVRPGVHRTGPS